MTSGQLVDSQARNKSLTSFFPLLSVYIPILTCRSSDVAKKKEEGEIRGQEGVTKKGSNKEERRGQKKEGVKSFVDKSGP